MILRLRLSRLYILLLIFLSASTYSSSQLEVGDWDIDDDGRADALTDGLFFLRYTFGPVSYTHLTLPTTTIV